MRRTKPVQVEDIMASGLSLKVSLYRVLESGLRTHDPLMPGQRDLGEAPQSYF